MREDDRRVVSSTAAEVDRQTAVPRAWVVSVRRVVHHKVVAEAVHLAVEAAETEPPEPAEAATVARPRWTPDPNRSEPQRPSDRRFAGGNELAAYPIRSARREPPLQRAYRACRHLPSTAIAAPHCTATCPSPQPDPHLSPHATHLKATHLKNSAQGSRKPLCAAYTNLPMLGWGAHI
jgi:hypothetical protein